MEDEENDVHVIPTFYILGGISSVVITKVSFTSEILVTARVPAPAPVHSNQKTSPKSLGGGLNSKKTNKENKKIRDQQVSDTCYAASCNMRELYRYRGTAVPIAALTLTTSKPIIMVPPPT